MGLDGIRTARDSLLVRPNELRPFLVALVLVALARAQAMVDYTYAVDDYAQIINGLRSFVAAFIKQGRIGEYWLVEAFAFIGYDPGRAPIITLLLIVVLSVWTANGILRLLDVEVPDWTRALLIVVIAAHPYTFEILTFRLISIYHVLSYAVAIYAILLARMSVSGLAASSLVFSFALTIYQVPLSLVSTLLVIDLSLRILRWSKGGSKPWDGIFSARLIAVVLGLILYVLWLYLSRGFQEPSVRGALVGLHDVPGRLWLGVTMLYGHFVDGSAFWVPLTPQPIMFIPIGFACAAGLAAVARLTGRSMIAAGTIIATPFMAGLAMLGMPLIAQLLFIPPRVLPHIGLIWAWAALTAWIMLSSRFHNAVTGLLGLVAFVFVVQNNQLFLDHARIGARDKNLALRIVGRLEQITPIPKRVHVESAAASPSGTVNTTNYGLNDSVLLYWWSAPSMMTELTGIPFEPATMEEQAEAKTLCPTTPKWPADGAIVVRGELAIVCL